MNTLLARLRLSEWLRPELVRSRLAWRIVVSLVLAVGVPVLMFAGLGREVLDVLSRRLDEHERAQLVRAVARQVLDRLVDARDLMAVWPAQVPADATEAAAGEAGRARLPGVGRRFSQAVLLDGSGAVRWHVGADGGDPARAPVGLQPLLSGGPGRSGHRLIAREYNGRIQLLLAAPPQADGMRWVAELEPAALWQPVAEASGDAAWCVQDAQGLRLYCPARQIAGLDGGVGRVHTGWNLVLRGVVDAADWQFDLVSARSGALTTGLPVGRVLAVGLAVALFVVAVLSVVLVRRTLVPLWRLHAGTRQVARREAGARVEVAGNDEFAALAAAFNDMAERIDEQFRSLELLASIDRDIVGHRAVDEVFRRVLVQGLRGLGARVMGLARIESERVPRLHLQWNDEVYVQKVRRSVRALAPAEYQAILEMTDDGDWPPEGVALSASSWCTPMRWKKGARLLAFPLRWQDRTHGLLLVGWSQAPSSQRRRDVAELRDRLSVALAAHQRELELTWQARHDDLTGLLNRNGLHQELDVLLAEPDGAARAEQAGNLAVLFIDLDHFKTVNDNLGHGQGDELLRQAADRLEACAPTRSIAARPGGDEFVLVLPQADVEAAVTVASAVCRRMALPFSLSGKDYFLGASVGIALAPLHGHTRTTLLRHADMAMYTAKDAGRGRHAMFEEPLDALLLERSSLLADLRQAVAREELVLHFQPRVSTPDGQIASAEALIRWRHPTRGLLSPGLFIPLAEESDLIESIGLWVIRAACAQLARWRREGVPLKRLSVNVSPRQLQSGRLVDEVETTLVQHGVPWSLLELEVTESLLVGDARAASEQLGQLRERGVMIALDDFGTGYSSMATLRNLPIDVMKVDRAFVSDLCEDPSALAITRAILTLAKSLGKHTVAEGIETQEQADVLRQLGCDELQGFLFSKPVPADEFAALCVFNAQVPPAPVPPPAVPSQPASRGAPAELV